jgi:hypothetical protein
MINKAGSESIIQWYGSTDLEPYQNVTDTKHCLEGQKLRKVNKNFLYIILVSGKNNGCKTTATPKCLGRILSPAPVPPSPQKRYFLLSYF